MSLPEMDQLRQAKQLAMANSPEQMLPKVLETSASLYHSKGTPPSLKLELSRFISSLLLDVIVHGQISQSQKPFIVSQHLDCLWSICRDVRDSIAYKFSILAFSASYPLLFDLVAKTSNQKMWDTMQQMKSFIVSNWNTTYPLISTTDIENEMFNDDARNIGIRLATAKFISEIVIVHTSRNSSSNNSGKNKITSISISTVPDNHPVISNKQAIESEAKRFLDILLNYLIEEPMMVSSIFIGVLNCLSFVMKQRPQATMRIITALLKFNVDGKYQADNISVLNYRLGKRFVERCYKNFVQFGLKSQLIKSLGSMSSQHSKLSKISQTLHVIGEETKSKGILSLDSDEMGNKMTSKDKQKCLLSRKKQQAIKAGIKDQPLSSVASPVISQATLNTIDNAVTNSSSDVNNRNVGNSGNLSMNGSAAVNNNVSIPVESANIDANTKLLMSLQSYAMSKSNIPNFFNSSPIAIDNSYCSIYSLMNSKNSEQSMSSLPQNIIIKLCSEAFYKTDTTRMISGLSIVASRYTDLMNKASQRQTDSKKRKAEDQSEQEDHDDSKKMKKEGSQELKNNDIEEEGDDNYDYGIINQPNENEVELIKPKAMTIEQKMSHLGRIVRNIMSIKDSDENPGIASTLGKGQLPLEKIKLLEWENSSSWLYILTRLATRGLSSNEKMSDFIRQMLYDYFIQDFNGRIGMVLEWLAEEWYNESLSDSNAGVSSDTSKFTNYDKWSLKLLEGLNPLLENQHRRTFIRLMSELPHIQQQHIDMIRPICLDPARTSLGFQTLKFLVMFRPPVKPMVKILLETIKEEDTTAQEQCNAILNKFY